MLAGRFADSERDENETRRKKGGNAELLALAAPPGETIVACRLTVLRVGVYSKYSNYLLQ
jgi:hypothetical protein